MNREEILQTALRCITGQREQDYGKPEDNFIRIAKLWNAQFGTSFGATDVAIALALLKIARLSNTPSHEDSWVDLAGYAACGGEIATHTNHLTKSYKPVAEAV